MASSPAPEHRGLLGARDGALLRVVAGDDDDDDDALLVADDQLRARSSLAAFVIITVSVVLVAGMFGAMLFVGRHQAIIDTFEDDDEDNFDVGPCRTQTRAPLFADWPSRRAVRWNPGPS